MVNQYYETGGQRASRVNDLFAAIASRYDLINDLQSFGLHRVWKRKVARLAAVQPGARALDLCCGTGDIAFALAARGADVVGLDFSEPMLAVARKRAEVQASRFADTATLPSAIHAPHFLRGDALRIPFPDKHFDLVTIGYGLRNLASFEGGLREMGRVAKPGGRLLVLDFGVPDNALWRRLYFAYLRCFVPVLGRVFCGNAAAYAYILESLKNYPAQKGVAAKMRELGCRQVQIHNLLGGMMSINYGEKPA
ncbi:MAG: class I SAM-dependent methyltransferase [Pedosphaera parvula]|nr:class I SAM-dependent methyltransferase [Pedosphaera parvula]